MSAILPETIDCIVDHRVLLLGTDAIYRKSMEQLETAVLLPKVEMVATSLGISELKVPVEGYYINSPKATRYFRLMRGLQQVDEALLSRVKNLPDFQEIWKIVSSPIFGRPVTKAKLLPQGRDPLSQALLDTINSQWEVEKLVDLSYKVSVETNDISLVGLAARLKDPIVITALRESVILYAEKIMRGTISEPRYKFVWKVDNHFAKVTNQFIEEFNGFLPDYLKGIPLAEPENAEEFFRAASKNKILGRCANLGADDSLPEPLYYHWAITKQNEELVLDAFWSRELWTTEKYTSEQIRLGWKFIKEI
jgi:hypothetical protein